MKKLINFIKEYWGAMSVLSGIILTIGGFLGTAIWTTYGEPKFNTAVAGVMRDSISPVVNNVISNRPAGFRTQLHEKTNIPKDHVADSIALMYNNEKYITAKIGSAERKIEYLMGLSYFLINQVTSKTNHNGVELHLTGTGDAYYMDKNGMLWHAFYVIHDDKYYYFPPYADGSRIECK